MSITRIVSYCLGLILSLTAITSLAQLKTLDGIAAIVDDNVVLLSEFVERVDSIEKRIEASGQSSPPKVILNQQVIERLISDRVQLNRAERMGVNIPVEEINAAFERLAKSRNLTAQQYAVGLESQGFSITDIRSQLEQEIILSQVQSYHVNRRIDISGNEIESFLQSGEGQFWREPDYFVGHIVFPLGSDEQNIQAYREVDEVLQQLKNGEDFKSLAIRYSKGPTALEGGDIGWRKVAEFPTEISEAIAGLDVGEYSVPVESNNGVHILKVFNKRDNQQEMMIEQNKVRHILIPTNEIRNDAEAQGLAQSLADRVRAGESFEDLAKQYSEDFGSALQGGDLGWVLPGQMVPEFEQGTKQAKVNDVTDPIRSEFGWHIILVDGRKEVDMREDMIRNQVANLLRSRRYDEELQLWIQELRDEAFVKIMLSDEALGKEDEIKLNI